MEALISWELKYNECENVQTSKRSETFLAHTLEHISKATEWQWEELCHCLNVPASHSKRITKNNRKKKYKKTSKTNKMNLKNKKVLEIHAEPATWQDKWNLDLDMAAFGFYAPSSSGGNLV